METGNETSTIISSWDQLLKDMRSSGFLSLKVKSIAKGDRIDFGPPFYRDTYGEVCYGVISVRCEQGEVPQYPLTCRSKQSEEEFIVKSREDWKNHAEKFIA